MDFVFIMALAVAAVFGQEYYPKKHPVGLTLDPKNRLDMLDQGLPNTELLMSFVVRPCQFLLYLVFMLLEFSELYFRLIKWFSTEFCDLLKYHLQ